MGGSVGGKGSMQRGMPMTSAGLPSVPTGMPNQGIASMYPPPMQSPPMQQGGVPRQSVNADRSAMPLRTQMYAQQRGLQQQAAQRGIASLNAYNAQPRVSWSPAPTPTGGGSMFPGGTGAGKVTQPTYSAPAYKAPAQAAAASSSGGGGGGAAATKSVSSMKQSAKAGVMPPASYQASNPVNYHILKTTALRARGGLRGRNG